MNVISDYDPLPLEFLDLLNLLAQFYLENNRPEKASVLLAALEALGGADDQSLIRQAFAHVRSGQPALALETLDRLAMRGAIDVLFHLIRAQAFLAMGQVEKSAAAMKHYVSLRESLGRESENTQRASA